MEEIMQLDKNRLAEECARLDQEFEQALADEGVLIESGEWPRE
jgi:hypothetical protein